MPEYRDESVCCQCFQSITFAQSGYWRGQDGITCQARTPRGLHRVVPALKNLSMEGVEAWLDL